MAYVYVDIPDAVAVQDWTKAVGFIISNQEYCIPKFIPALSSPASSVGAYAINYQSGVPEIVRLHNLVIERLLVRAADACP
jgi:hypothetical protein